MFFLPGQDHLPDIGTNFLAEAALDRADGLPDRAADSGGVGRAVRLDDRAADADDDGPARFAVVHGLADAVQARFGAADMLINNAGQGYVAHFHDTPREAWLHEAELKLFGVINPVKAFQSLLEASDIASITCVNSLLALQPEEHMIATSAARAALLNMTLTLSKELVDKGIRVNSILLGMVESGQWQRRFESRSDKSQSWQQWTADIARKRGIPMARLGKPQEPAQALLFLASPLASFTTGAALDVSGGFCRHL